MNGANNLSGGGLYAAHQKVYPREIQGRFNRLRVIATLSLLGIFYGLPWLRWDDRQALLFDLPARKFYIFGLTFFPQDFFLLAWLLVIAALSLFFFTALAGRLWCGYACPQTVWTEAFVWLERITEGSRQQRIKLDKGSWNANKLARKSIKQLLWVTFALFTGFTFVGYFAPISHLFRELQTASFGWEHFWAFFYAFATYGNAGYMREQVCKYMCPYARFQSAMFDKNSLIISYDTVRGEPRGARARGVDARASGLGDCIDCTMCVQVCPTGIDIRKGLQLECIACAACIDACDQVMDRMQYPRGLIRYSTQAAMEGNRVRIWRPRTIVYGTLLFVLIAGFSAAVLNRKLIVLDVMRDRNALYRQLNDGSIENVYTLRIVNKDTRAHVLRLSVEKLTDAVLDTDRTEYSSAPGSVFSLAARVRVPAHSLSGGKDIAIVAIATDDGTISARSDARFIAPVSP